MSWLRNGDASIRWQVMQDLEGSPAEEIKQERSRVEHEGWGARLLSLQDPNGLWAGGTFMPSDYIGGEPGQPWTATAHTLQTLKILGLEPGSDSAKRTIDLVAENARWDHASQRFFDGEVEPCINGRLVECGAYFGIDVKPVVERLLNETMDEGGWNCEAENGSTRTSIDTSINVLEGLVEYEEATGGSPEVSAARRDAEEYLLERGLFRRKSTGEVADPGFLDFVFPFYWHYDVLRALDYFRRSGRDRDPRLEESIELVRSKRQPDGRWLLDGTHPGRVHFHMEQAGEPSRWNTLRALRVLNWWDRAEERHS